ncbi:MAG: hypothetical protein LC725_03435, partial [Lentisphaerae bacterium]|nr:hypothetical protein [Lentisphaerota bacterium]
DGRYLLPVFPAVLILMLNGARRVLILCRRKRGPWPARLLVGLSLALLLGARFAFPPRLLGGSGFGMPAADLLADSKADGQAWLVSSDARGEGMFVAQVAMREQRRPTHFALRASKMLADSSWDGQDYQALFSTPGDLRDFLLASPVGVILLDTTMPPDRRVPHHALLELTLRDFPRDFNLLNTYPLTRDGIFYPKGLLVYRVAGRSTMTQLELEASLERILRRRVPDR